METDFWLERWERNQIGFHQDAVNSYLIKHLPELRLRAGDPVFVPLCGKTLDMLWLDEQGYAVLGVELSPLAIESFFKENARRVRCVQAGMFTRWTSGSLDILCGDFFDLTREDLGGAKAVYDRASLIALPPHMRPAYAAHMAGLLPSASRILLVTLEYPEGEMAGPPFSVGEREVRRLYHDWFDVKVLGSTDILAQNPRFRDRGLTRLCEIVYLLVKNSDAGP